MNIRKLYFALPLLFLFAFSSCQKPLEDENIDYIGSWGSDKWSIEIWKNGRGVLERRNLDPAECRIMIEEGFIKFRGGRNRKFRIDEPPFVNTDGYWVMTLDGDTFYLH